jgi:hypothetical protein
LFVDVGHVNRLTLSSGVTLVTSRQEQVNDQLKLVTDRTGELITRRDLYHAISYLTAYIIVKLETL